MSNSQKTILLGVTGSIAAYKAADIASALTKAGHSVHAILTDEATHYVTPFLLQNLTRNHVTVRLRDEAPGRPPHIEIAERAHLALVAPATANLIAKHALGIADDALTTILLATRAPLLIAPAMNGNMWLHPAIQAHVETLKSRGARFIGPDTGMLACGYEGIGRLWSPEGIAARALELVGGPVA
ncbi:MAG: phosphopantothenoylcysteine decarboxylase [Verrucomicrobiae bacterium]|nr:phosphopantothenoylcysteine decarboxylase [Verrucomicrobiae bacterium]